jgi:hypothetical protein
LLSTASTRRLHLLFTGALVLTVVILVVVTLVAFPQSG